ncbi:Mur ligase family protein [Amnibacterium sp.]|uniref:bifunctional folylpolyglutamate synthase/dihydrofolate synthase n=1 Tax=Amnibacterium sp. TaxID=1872496 RepID=UPI0026349867|nr:Mur ligase family protein [Amnibacterium sp.]MCU1474918.1 dihydrofolate synthase [Amnibacterium sp.]
MSDRSALDGMLDAIYARVGEVAPQPRLTATRRALELLGDPHRAYPIVHITGTNGKTSTSRIIESLLRAQNLRTGLFTSPDLGRLNERIVVDGEPIDDDTLLRNWHDVEPYIGLADQELEAAGEAPLTFFEALTVLAYATFADAPIDVGVIEVGMGGEWDSTNVADGQVAVFTPIDLDHTDRLGKTIGAIARTKAGIIKPGRSVVSAIQAPEALAEVERAAELSEAAVSLEGRDFRVLARTPAVGGQLVDVQGRVGRYDGIFVPLLGAHQAQNAAVAIAAVETFVGDGTLAIDRQVLDEGLALATSPGRLQVVPTGSATGVTVVVDAAHNPHGAAALAAGLAESFHFSHVVAVLAVLSDKDAAGMVRAVADVVDEFVVTAAPSARGMDPDELARVVVDVVGADRVIVEPDLERALQTAREQAADAPEGDEGEAVPGGTAPGSLPDPSEPASGGPGVIAFGSITLVARVLQIARENGWSPS